MSWATQHLFSKTVIGPGRNKQQTDPAGLSDGAGRMAVDETLGAVSAFTQCAVDVGQAAADQTSATSVRAPAMALGMLAQVLVSGAGPAC